MAARLALLRGSTSVGKDDDEDWYEPIPVSELPPNEWQRELDALIELEREIHAEAERDREAEMEERHRPQQPMVRKPRVREARVQEQSAAKEPEQD